MFEPHVRDLVALRRELGQLADLLGGHRPLGEAKDIMPLLRTTRHLVAYLNQPNILEILHILQHVRSYSIYKVSHIQVTEYAADLRLSG